MSEGMWVFVWTLLIVLLVVILWAALVARQILALRGV